MPNRNMHEVMGHLGRDPELRYTTSNNPVCSFSIATSNDFKRGGQWIKNPPEWHNVVIWGELAQLVVNEFKKGDAIMVRGRSKTREYESKGQKRRITEVIANEVYMPIYPKKAQDSQVVEEPMIDDYDELPDADIPF